MNLNNVMGNITMDQLNNLFDDEFLAKFDEITQEETIPVELTTTELTILEMAFVDRSNKKIKKSMTKAIREQFKDNIIGELFNYCNDAIGDVVIDKIKAKLMKANIEVRERIDERVEEIES